MQQTLALAGWLALEGDAFLHRWMTEGVGTPTELPPSFRIVFRESRRGTWWGVTGRFLILLKRTISDREKEVRVYMETILQ